MAKTITSTSTLNKLLNDFSTWAANGVVTPGVSSNYKGWLNKIGSNFSINLLNEIAQFYEAGDILYALSYYDKLLDSFNNITGKGKLWSNTHSALACLGRFLGSKRITTTSPDKYDGLRKKINKPDIHKINGIENIVSSLGLSNFIRLAIEGSYFFISDIVTDRHTCLSTDLENGTNVPARKTTKNSNGNYTHIQQNGNWYYTEKNTGVSIPIIIDKDGNQNVRSIINSYTGYTVCQGKDSVFQNYAISHIWGRAFDPRYFTSLWNVVLIPDWANGLMDKINPEQGSLESILQSTIQEICRELYFNKLGGNWFNNIQIPTCPTISNTNDIQNGTYNLNIIGRKTTTNNSLVAKITQQQITV